MIMPLFICPGCGLGVSYLAEPRTSPLTHPENFRCECGGVRERAIPEFDTAAARARHEPRPAHAATARSAP